MEKFIEVAKNFISWVDAADHRSTEEMIVLNSIVLSLYSLAFDLKCYSDAEDLDGEGMTHEEWQEVRDRLKDLPFDNYKTIYNLLELNEDAIVGSLSDDLADIYRDIKPLVGVFDRGQIKEAEDGLKMSFEIHWSQHSVSALKVLRQYLQNEVWDLS